MRKLSKPGVTLTVLALIEPNANFGYTVDVNVIYSVAKTITLSSKYTKLNHHKVAMTKCPLRQTENRLPETATARVQSETGNQEALMQNKFEEKERSCTNSTKKKKPVFVMNIIYYTHP